MPSQIVEARDLYLFPFLIAIANLPEPFGEGSGLSGLVQEDRPKVMVDPFPEALDVPSDKYELVLDGDELKVARQKGPPNRRTVYDRDEQNRA
jgi:hypothetical protein